MPNNSSQSNKLIVDFPPNPRQRNGPILRSKSVRFATHGRGVYVNYPSREVDKRWYSKEEMEHFGDMVGLDSVQCSKAIIVEDKNKNEMESKKFLVNCVGLEHLISRDVPRRYKANKRGRKHHSKLVLAEQKRQKENHDESVSMLAYVSSKSSRPFRMRAYTIAEMRTHMV